LDIIETYYIQGRSQQQYTP